MGHFLCDVIKCYCVTFLSYVTINRIKEASDALLY